jgi:multidrug transporter EmrE-like cation transporter
MSFKTIALVLFSVFLATAGQLLLKTGMAKVGYIDSMRLGNPLGLVGDVLRTWQVIAGLAVFVLSAMSWLVVMSRVPLSFAYPFVGITYVLLALFGKFVIHEHVPNLRWLGVALIVAGIVVVGKTSPPEEVPTKPAQQAVSSSSN